ncbi:hypothetical protein MA20_43220 [Bradyrhizobium japonicum]|uniref:Uncharacterized protein n=1 Tax=Bradyrhizobium japonicum TaxID=375 RepID=A0A0A3XH48_BRAJP|nr:hypothetical protein MA20_43220 [Bradyrhizobium japonicum]
MVITAAARIRKAGCRDAAVLSHHLGVPERRDLVCTEAELLQDLVVCSPNSGGRATILLGVRDSVTGWPTSRM